MDNFKQILKDYLQLKSISQSKLANVLGNAPTTVNSFLKRDAPPQLRTRLKYFEKLDGFEDFYNKEIGNIIESYARKDRMVKIGESKVNLNSGLLHHPEEMDVLVDFLLVHHKKLLQNEKYAGFVRLITIE